MEWEIIKKIKSNRKKNGVGNHKKINTKIYLIFHK